MHLQTVLTLLQITACAAQRTAGEVINLLNLQPNIEKGYFRETFADVRTVEGDRAASTAIYYLLEGRVGWAEWHRVDAVEVWYVSRFLFDFTPQLHLSALQYLVRRHG